MLYITGDVHAMQKKWLEQIHPLLKAGDSLIVAGDFGFGFLEDVFYDWLARQPYTVLVVDGNHENFDQLEACPVKDWHGGRVHVVRENLLHLMRGEIYELDGLSVFTFGGGYSLDKPMRVEGKNWWPQELPSGEEYEHARDSLQKHGNQVDVIVTHTCPSETAAYMATFGRCAIRRDVVQELPLNTFLDDVCASVSYRHYYFGHFHMDRELWRGQTVLFNTVRELETGKIVRQWETYEAF